MVVRCRRVIYSIRDDARIHAAHNISVCNYQLGLLSTCYRFRKFRVSSSRSMQAGVTFTSSTAPLLDASTSARGCSECREPSLCRSAQHCARSLPHHHRTSDYHPCPTLSALALRTTIDRSTPPRCDTSPSSKWGKGVPVPGEDRRKTVCALLGGTRRARRVRSRDQQRGKEPRVWRRSRATAD